VGSGTNREIERKFLVDAARVPAAARQHGARFEQGYLSFTPSVRVRRSERDGAEPEAWITIKGPGMIDRAEFEYPIPAADARELLKLCAARLTKTRYRVPFGKHVWDLDEFSGAHHGLWLAEVELAAADESFERPPWLGIEVSGDARYANSALASAGRAP
jgi:CYTH domain-containing protein